MPKDPIKKLLFIYNADSGLRNELLDAAHKVLSPGTYQCRLCELTFGTFREKSMWRKFRQNIDLPMEFLHRDEFLEKYSSKFMQAYTFPVILEVTDHEIDIFLATKDLNALKETEDLIEAIQLRLV